MRPSARGLKKGGYEDATVVSHENNLFTAVGAVTHNINVISTPFSCVEIYDFRVIDTNPWLKRTRIL